MTEEPMPWFPCFPAKWLKALGGMKPDEGYVYVIVCFMIYDRGTACQDTLESISRRTGLNRRRVADALDRLFKSGKLVRQGDGIMNPFAEQILTDQAAFRAERSKAGAAGASSRWGKTKQNQGRKNGKAKPEPMANDGQLQLEGEEKKKEKKEVEPREPRGKHRLPPDWNPGEPGYVYAQQKGFTRAEAEQMFVGFREHHIGRGTVWEVWMLAWQQWCRNEVKFSARRRGTQKNGGPTMFDIASGRNGAHR